MNNRTSTCFTGSYLAKAPGFAGNAPSLTERFFNLDEETFEFYALLKVRNNPLWSHIAEVMQIDAGEAIQRLVTIPESNS